MGQGRLLSGALATVASLVGSVSFAADLIGAAPQFADESAATLRARPSVAVVVPACSQKSWSLLLQCQPREDVYFPQDIGLIQIERTRAGVPRTPYPALVPR